MWTHWCKNRTHSCWELKRSKMLKLSVIYGLSWISLAVGVKLVLLPMRTKREFLWWFFTIAKSRCRWEFDSILVLFWLSPKPCSVFALMPSYSIDIAILAYKLSFRMKLLLQLLYYLFELNVKVLNSWVILCFSLILSNISNIQRFVYFCVYFHRRFLSNTSHFH